MRLLKPAEFLKHYLSLLLLFLGSFSSELAAQRIVTGLNVTSTSHLLGTTDCGLQLSISSNLPSCEGNTVCLAVSGGLPPYTIYLNGQRHSSSLLGLDICLKNLRQGEHIIKVIDSRGCESKLSVNIPALSDLLRPVITPVTCRNGAGGAIALNLSALAGIDISTLFFRWEGPDGYHGEGREIQGLRPGKYTVHIFAIGNICIGTASWEVPQADPIQINVNIANATCGAANVCAYIRGGKAPYRIWGFRSLPAEVTNSNFENIMRPDRHPQNEGTLYNPNTTNSPFCVNNLPAGYYYILVQDANGCYAWQVFKVNPSARFERWVDVKNVSCFGKKDAKICFKINGNSPPYKTTLAGANASSVRTIEGKEGCFENVAPGEYLLSTTDGSGCTSSERIKIVEPEVLEAEFVLENNNCQDGASGCLKIKGGTGAYRIYVWKHPNPTANVGFEIDFYENGIPYVVDAQRSTDFQFPPVWGADRSFCARNIPPGDYILLVVDANNCYEIVVVHIPNLGGLNAKFELTSSACSEWASGCLTIEGGSQPYKVYVFGWNTAPGVTPPVRFDADGRPQIAGGRLVNWQWSTPGIAPPYQICTEGIAPGFYLIIVVDANGCYTIEKVTVPRGTNLRAEFQLTSNVCSETASGCLTISGGTQPYKIFVWRHRNPAAADANIAVEFDAEGNPQIRNNDFESANEFGFDEENDPTASVYRRCSRNIPPGYYIILVVDANGCYTLLHIRIPIQNPIKVRFEITSESCDAGVDGCLYVEGGTEPYNIFVWKWNSPLTVIPRVIFENGRPRLDPPGAELVNWSWQVNSDDATYRRCAENIAPGSYFILVVDKNGCYELLPVTIRPNNGIQLSTRVKNVSCNGENDGQVYLNIAGGEPPYTIYFNGNQDDGTTTDNRLSVLFDSLEAGIYKIEVKDKNGCSAAVEVKISEPEPLTATFILEHNSACEAAIGGCIKVTGGTAPYRLRFWQWDSASGDAPNVYFDETTNQYVVEGATELDFPIVPPTPNTVNWCIRRIPPGQYLVLVTDANKCYTLLLFQIDAPNPLRVSAEVTHATCNAAGGTIELRIQGGEAPYTIQHNREWTTNDTLVKLEDVPSGTYMIYITDKRGCKVEIKVVVRSETLEARLRFDKFGEFACVNPSGGAAPYKIEWTNLETGSVISNDSCVYDLTAGVYVVSIFDRSGCNSKHWVIIDPKPCQAGIAKVEKEWINSGETNTFSLFRSQSSSIQWQFRTQFTEWINIPDATEETFVTPPLHAAMEEVIFVRAKVTCQNGGVGYSLEASFLVRGNGLLNPVDPRAADTQLFNPEFRQTEVQLLDQNQAQNPTTLVYPTVSRDRVKVRFNATANQSVKIFIINNLGAVVQQIQRDQISSGEEVELSVSQFAPGNYFVRIESGAILETQRIIVQ